MSTPSQLTLREITLSDWSAPEIRKALEERPLFLHVKRQRNALSTEQKRIILLVHGVSSGAATWLPFLSHAFPRPELEAFDFGLFNYQTSLVSRINPFQRLPNPEEWADVIANFIRNTILNEERYDSYVLVGHSMGGLISKFVIRSFFEKDRAAAMHLHSLFSYGTPNHGSDRATAITSLLSPDLALLREFSSPVQYLQTFWNTYISSVINTPGKFTVHERAVVSAKDYWVAPASAMNSLPEPFVERVACSHTALIQPTGSNDPRLSWFVAQLQAIQRFTECSLIELRDGPVADDFLGEDVGEKLIAAIFRSRVVLDAGALHGIAKGDLFGLCHEAEVVRDANGRVIDRIPGLMSLIAAIEVRESVTYCKLESLAYEPALRSMQRAIDALGTDPDQVIDDEQIASVVLALFGRRAVRIPRQESDARERLEATYGNARDEEKSSTKRRKFLLELLTASRDFLGAHPGSILADRAAFHEAWATMELERYGEAELLFQRFCDNYPFSVSVSGARDWIKEIRLRINLADSNNDAHQQLLLAEHLFKEDRWRDLDEIMRLAFEAYSTRRTLLTKMSAGMRFLLTCKYLCHEVLGMSLEDPEAIQGLIDDCRRNPPKRDEIRAKVEASIASDRARLLLDLFDSNEAPQQPENP